ncbi:hypothetical protein BCR36DRAFT_374140 [Piromyces finnis]|uniref:Uncharacterized protein n=1 Tax=Piromyces finnis TaxID=1754191 RepID=A0A1Y1UXQ6_9FUNG|nr:hypothetical protein BCR36DRAFT_374140 [Piromyces finnis]|eukprot:ORX42951.1 hypothetical protein BCR36DRAFT_374140 [Piromyces finnis]
MNIDKFISYENLTLTSGEYSYEELTSFKYFISILESDECRNLQITSNATNINNNNNNNILLLLLLLILVKYWDICNNINKKGNKDNNKFLLPGEKLVYQYDNEVYLTLNETQVVWILGYTIESCEKTKELKLFDNGLKLI